MDDIVQHPEAHVLLGANTLPSYERRLVMRLHVVLLKQLLLGSGQWYPTSLEASVTAKI